MLNNRTFKLDIVFVECYMLSSYIDTILVGISWPTRANISIYKTNVDIDTSVSVHVFL